MNKKKLTTLIAASLAVVMALSLLLGLLPGTAMAASSGESLDRVSFKSIYGASFPLSMTFFPGLSISAPVFTGFFLFCLYRQLQADKRPDVM